MIAGKRLLVVDDEAVVCQSCARIFSDRGLQIDTSTSSEEGLQMASDHPYNAILLDIQMPHIDGIEFLEKLREDNPATPVVIITGYSSIPSAAAAMRLGANDYISKPFTPDEIIKAVERILQEDDEIAEPETDLYPTKEGQSKANVPSSPDLVSPFDLTEDSEYENAVEDIRFYKDAWVKTQCQNTARVGAFLSPTEARSFQSASLPRVGDMIYQGLPLAQFYDAHQNVKVVYSPLSGRVVATNPHLYTHPAAGWNHPCQDAWIAVIQPTQFSLDVQQCKARNAILLTRTEQWYEETRILEHLACRVSTVETYEELIEKIQANNASLVFLDAASYGISGPGIVRKLKVSHPNVKTVVVQDLDNIRETDYRIAAPFYYAMNPFQDGEILDIVNAAFQEERKTIPYSHGSEYLPKRINHIKITNRKGENISLFSSSNLLVRHQGVGWEVIESILHQGYPLHVNLTSQDSLEEEMRNELQVSEKVFFLESSDAGRIPGSMMK